MKKIITIGILFGFLTLTGCASTAVKSGIQSNDMNNYSNISIQKVKVYSEEANAKNNEPLQVKLKNWERFSRTELEGYVEKSKYQLVDAIDDETLLVDLDVNVEYGNRALRWAVGFGAGKGGVDSIITVKDSRSGEIKYQASAESELTMGAAGGDIEETLKENIKKLIDAYKKYNKAIKSDS